MFGWKGKVLFVNLKTKTTRETDLDPKVAQDYIGGRGLGIYYLSQLLDPKYDPLSSENILIKWRVKFYRILIWRTSCLILKK